MRRDSDCHRFVAAEIFLNQASYSPFWNSTGEKLGSSFPGETVRLLIAVPALLLAGNLAAQSNSSTQPTASEQTFMYEVNRARANPAAYDSENSLGGVCSSITPSRPLALNGNLVTSARFHSSEMAQYGYFAHQSTVTGQWPNQMARNAGYPLKSSLPNNTNNIESLAARGASSYNPADAVKALIADVGVNPPGHRYHLLAWGDTQGYIDFTRQFKEAGAGFASGQGWSGGGSGAYWSYHTGVRDNSNHAFITGVVYDDTNSNGRYDSGEGLSGVTVNLSHWSSGQQQGSVTTSAGGGYVFQLSNGVYVLEVSGGAFSGTRWAKVTVANYNSMQVDFRSDSMDVDTNFGSWGALSDSATTDGSQPPAPPPTSGGGSSGGTTGGSGGGTVAVNPNEPVDWGDNQGCAAVTSTRTWLLLLLLSLAAGVATAGRISRQS